MPTVSTLEAKAAQASSVVYTKATNGNTTGTLSDYTMVSQFNDLTDVRVDEQNRLDLQMAIYRANDDSNLIIVFRGTELNRPLDILADADLGWSQWNTNKSFIMDDIYAAIEAAIVLKPNVTITVTGHSLGGMQAQYAAYELQKDLGTAGVWEGEVA